MIFTTTNYQKRGIDMLLQKKHAGLLFDPGLGKTATTLAALAQLFKNPGYEKALIIAPLTVCQNTWPDEIEKWEFPFDYVHVPKIKKLDFNRPEKIWLINPEVSQLRKLFSAIKKPETDFPFQILIVDESTKFKNWGSKRFKFLRNYLPYFKRRVILTGSFTPNSLIDAFAQIQILDLGEALGSKITQFRRKYCVMDNPKYFTYKIRDKRAEQEIEQAIAPMLLRLAKEDYLDLPDVRDNLIKLALTPGQQKQYDAVESQLIADIAQHDVVAKNAANKYQLCRQLSNGRFYRDKETLEFHDLKARALDNLIEELQGNPLLVAYEYTCDYDQITEKVGKFPVINGKTPADDRHKLITQWNLGKLPVLCVQTSTVSHGLNLQKGGHNLCIYSMTNNLENHVQLINRLHRLGTIKPVIVHYLLVKNTLDISMFRRLKFKLKREEEFLREIERYAEEKNRLYAGHRRLNV